MRVLKPLDIIILINFLNMTKFTKFFRKFLIVLRLLFRNIYHILVLQFKFLQLFNEFHDESFFI